MSTHTVIPAIQPTVDAENPWPGLLAFRETDEGYFQGRKTETESLLRMVLRERLTVLYGLSGLGKSSLLQAGLFPRLRPQDVFPVYLRLDFSGNGRDLTSQVLSVIATEAAARNIEAPAPEPGESLWEYFHRADNNFWNERNRPVLPLLVFDQFEEVFTLGRLNPERTAVSDAFLTQLAELVEGRPPAALKQAVDDHPEKAAAFQFDRHYYKVLLGLREDYLPELEALRTRMPRLALNRLRLCRMKGDAALLVVNQVPKLIDSDVAEQVVRFVAADKQQRELVDLEVEPALLSVVCRELNLRRIALGEPKITAALLQGSQEKVLADFYERCMADVAPELRAFVEERLLTPYGYRESVALESATYTPGVSLPEIEKLIDRRLLRKEERGGQERLELTHDLLAGVIRASRDKRRQREAAEKEKAVLLAEQEKQKQQLLKMQEEERQRLERAQELEKQERDKQELRRIRKYAVVSTAMAILAVAMAFWAYVAQRQAESDRDKAIAAELQAKKEADENKKYAAAVIDRASPAVFSPESAGDSPQSGGDAGVSPRATRPGSSGRPEYERLTQQQQQQQQQALPPPPPPAPTESKESGSSSAAAEGPARLYIQIVNQDDKAFAAQLGAKFQAAGFAVQPIQYVPQASVLSRTDVRFYRKADADTAQKIVSILKSAGQTSARAYIPSGMENSPNVRPNTYEVWLANGASSGGGKGASAY